MNILFITFNNTKNAKSGGEQCSSQNLAVLSSFGNVEVLQIAHKNKLASLISIITLNFPPLNRKHYKQICNLIESKNIDIIYFDSSLFGRQIKLISKKYNLKKIVLFHNVEFDYIDVRFGKKILKYPFKILARMNEKDALTFSDLSICLSRRDKERLLELYKVNNISVLPLSLNDKFNTNFEVVQSKSKKTCLFVGSNIKPNRDGIFWFIENVLEFIPYELVIIGRGFEDIEHEIISQKVKLIGTVEDLSKYYLEADFVISPIFDGSGMKVKIAEALMFGRYIFGTNESFMGYDVTASLVGGICENAEDFKYEIKKFAALNLKSNLNEYSRNLFLEKYSFEALVKQYESILKN